MTGGGDESARQSGFGLIGTNGALIDGRFRSKGAAELTDRVGGLDSTNKKTITSGNALGTLT